MTATTPPGPPPQTTPELAAGCHIPTPSRESNGLHRLNDSLNFESSVPHESRAQDDSVIDQLR